MVCAQPFDSFDESQLGAFMESPLGARAGSPGIRVLVWDELDQGLFNESTGRFVFWYRVVNHLIDIGIKVDHNTNWRNDLSEYQLIFLVSPPVLPAWWSDLSGWSGRIYVQAPILPLIDGQIGSDAVLVDVLQHTDMVVRPNHRGSWNEDIGRFHFESHPLTAEFTSGSAEEFQWAADLTGGALLVWFARRSMPVLKEQTVLVGGGRISFVVDSWVLFSVGLRTTNSIHRLGENLYNVPV